ncbi:hypothetical protein BTJ40_06975 [Microbulbifer sp. A4B17]|nr:hypothetical protein BTJ40_06975 [Microbulbifer sp. A4B17]
MSRFKLELTDALWVLIEPCFPQLNVEKVAANPLITVHVLKVFYNFCGREYDGRIYLHLIHHQELAEGDSSFGRSKALGYRHGEDS